MYRSLDRVPLTFLVSSSQLYSSNVSTMNIVRLMPQCPEVSNCAFDRKTNHILGSDKAPDENRWGGFGQFRRGKLIKNSSTHYESRPKRIKTRRIHIVFGGNSLNAGVQPPWPALDDGPEFGSKLSTTTANAQFSQYFSYYYA